MKTRIFPVNNNSQNCVGLLFPCILILCGMGSARATEEEIEEAPPPRKCQDIVIPMCRGIGYNYTYTPNQFLHDTQEEAGLEVHQFWPLVEIRCSADLRFYLCSLYVPICMPDYNQPLPACRSVCKRAQAGCAPVMGQYGFAWPEKMSCDRLPEYGDKNRLCMQLNSSSKQTMVTSKYLQSSAISQPPVLTSAKDCSCACRTPFVSLRNQSSHLHNRITTGEQKNCAVPCAHVYFSVEDQTFTEFWMCLWAVLCLVSTLLTLLTFLIDNQRFPYPERPVVYLSACYSLVSLGFVIRIAVGHDVIACDSAADYSIVRYDSIGQLGCNLVFLLIYFFGMAANVWWVILSFTWFLAAGLKWGQEAVEEFSQYFHLASWIIPSAKTIAILAMSAVDGDPILGICYVGNQNLSALRGFVLAPLCIYLFLGSSFLIAGFVSLLKIRKAVVQQDIGPVIGTDKLDRFIYRVGTFSLLYTVPTAGVIACYFYEERNRLSWEASINCPCSVSPSQPEYGIFMLKYFMSLIAGVVSGFWTWSGKTFDSWRRFYRRLLHIKDKTRADTFPHPQPTAASEALIASVCMHTDLSCQSNLSNLNDSRCHYLLTKV